VFSVIVRRVLLGVLTVFTVITLTFVLVHAAPGEPFATMIEDARFTPEHHERLRQRYGLDQPVAVQYVRYLGQVARGNLGESFSARRPVTDVIGEALPRTLLLMGSALAVGFALGILLGIWQASRRHSAADRVASAATVTVGSIPDFWIAIGLMLLFAVQLRWFPVSGMVDPVMHDYMSPAGRVLDVLRHLALPGISLALLVMAVVARHQRAALIDALPEDYIRTATAKGVPPRAVLMHHAFRNALLPSITLLGLMLPALVGGAVFVESIFAWPGLGKAAIDAIRNRDLPVILGVTVLTSSVVVVASLVADLAYAAADPRTRRA
jgi:peptide/nickel transport system permease protein